MNGVVVSFVVALGISAAIAIFVATLVLSPVLTIAALFFMAIWFMSYMVMEG